MMGTSIHTVRTGINRCYLIRQEGLIMVDAGYANRTGVFRRTFDELAVRPGDVGLIVLTHGHFDHIGGASVLKELTGAPLAIHEKDRRDLEDGAFSWVRGVTIYGKVSRFLMRPVMIRTATPPPVKADIVLGDEDRSLKEFGLSGRILHTPGHTPGSVSIVLESGEAFVGCLAHNGFPFRFSPGLPIYADSVDQIRESWKKVLAAGARTIYPGHGDPFSADRIKKSL